MNTAKHIWPLATQYVDSFFVHDHARETYESSIGVSNFTVENLKFYIEKL